RRSGCGPGAAADVRRQPFQVLHERHQGHLHLYPVQPTPPSAIEAVLVLAFGKQVLAAHTQLSADLISSRLVLRTDRLACFTASDLLRASALPAQIEGASLVRGHR